MHEKRWVGERKLQKDVVASTLEQSQKTPNQQNSTS